PPPARPDRSPKHRPWAAFLAAATILLAACGGTSGGGSAACGEVVTEPLSPDAAVHVLDPARGGSEPSPTSGPHSPSVASGVLDRVLGAPEQVGVLERGDILIQYRPDDIEGESLAAVQAMAGARTVVAPNPNLAQPVVATAWLHRMSCEAVDTAALGRFAERYRDLNQGH
ncbi:MAG TPA: DUF3105 domain-containing protein, partial [Acidimicrobiales bacterium]|nr:DUF3105 domain-containing protein [Acidimicrobiales bacterium]